MSVIAQLYWMPYVRKCTVTDNSWASRQEHCRMQYILHTLVFNPQAGSAGTRAQSGDRYGSGTLHPGQVLRGRLPLLSPMQYIPLFKKMLIFCQSQKRTLSTLLFSCCLLIVFLLMTNFNTLRSDDADLRF